MTRIFVSSRHYNCNYGYVAVLFYQFIPQAFHHLPIADQWIFPKCYIHSQDSPLYILRGNTLYTKCISVLKIELVLANSPILHHAGVHLGLHCLPNDLFKVYKGLRRKLGDTIIWDVSVNVFEFKTDFYLVTVHFLSSRF